MLPLQFIPQWTGNFYGSLNHLRCVWAREEHSSKATLGRGMGTDIIFANTVSPDRDHKIMKYL